MVENKELIQNRQLMYQKACESKEDIKSTISACIGSGASMAGGLAIMLSTLSAPSWILGLLGAGVAVTPIGWVACGVGAFGAVAIPTITKIIKDDSRNVIAINGTPNHIHILIEPAKRDVKGLVDIIKEKTCDFAKGSMWFPLFEGWAEEYAVQMVEWRDSNSVIGDIKDQENYHTRITFEAEYADLLSRDKKEKES
jgi:hypothetical protein